MRSMPRQRAKAYGQYQRAHDGDPAAGMPMLPFEAVARIPEEMPDPI
jgi:hypothetical protein